MDSASLKSADFARQKPVTRLSGEATFSPIGSVPSEANQLFSARLSNAIKKTQPTKENQTLTSPLDSKLREKPNSVISSSPQPNSNLLQNNGNLLPLSNQLLSASGSPLMEGQFDPSVNSELIDQTKNLLVDDFGLEALQNGGMENLESGQTLVSQKLTMPTIPLMSDVAQPGLMNTPNSIPASTELRDDPLRNGLTSTSINLLGKSTELKPDLSPLKGNNVDQKPLDNSLFDKPQILQKISPLALPTQAILKEPLQVTSLIPSIVPATPQIVSTLGRDNKSTTPVFRDNSGTNAIAQNILSQIHATDVMQAKSAQAKNVISMSSNSAIINNSVSSESLGDFSQFIQSLSQKSEESALPKSFLQMTSKFGQPQWGQELGDKVHVLIQNNIKQAQLHINPRHLGPVEIQVSVSSEQQVNVSFNVQNAQVKEAIDLAMPRLREMLEQQGLNLANADVSQHSQQNRQKQTDSEAGGQHESSENEDLVTGSNAAIESVVTTSVGMLDIFV